MSQQNNGQHSTMESTDGIEIIRYHIQKHFKKLNFNLYIAPFSKLAKNRSKMQIQNPIQYNYQGKYKKFHLYKDFLASRPKHDPQEKKKKKDKLDCTEARYFCPL